MTTDGPEDDPAGHARALSHAERVVSVPYVAPKRGSVGFAAALAGSWCSSLPVDLWKWRVAALRRRAAELMAEKPFDVVVADFLFAEPNVPRDGKTPVVLFEHNVEFMIWKRLAAQERSWFKRALLEIEWRKLRRYEGRACERANLTIAVSEEDRAMLAPLAGNSPVASVPTGVDTDYFTPNPAREVPNRLVFSGAMDWHPNEDAMAHFVDEILPRIRARVPDVTLTIIGRNPSARVKALANQPGVTVTGTVADVRTHVAEGSLYVVPLRVGGGTRLKILEALSQGKPVLSTTIGAEGLALDPGKNIEIADDPQLFADRTVALLGDAARRAELSSAGRAVVEEKFSWTFVARQFEARMCEAPVDGQRVLGERAFTTRLKEARVEGRD